MTRRSILDGKWTLDTHATTCACGADVYLLRRNGMARLPAGHRCPAAEAQTDAIRTIRVEESVVRVSLTDAQGRLRSARS